MSDLAPFVAAVLRDEIVARLNDENVALRQELHDIRAVTITGPNGGPVYACAQLEDGRFCDDNYCVTFPNFPRLTNLVPEEDQQHQQDDPLVAYSRCSPGDLSNLEVRIGGLGRVEAVRRLEAVSGPFLRVIYIEDTRIGLWVYRSTTQASALVSLGIRISPFPSQAEFEAFDPNDVTHLQDERFQSLNVYFFMATFASPAVSGLIANFDQRRLQAQEVRAAAPAVDGLIADIAQLQQQAQEAGANAADADAAAAHMIAHFIQRLQEPAAAAAAARPANVDDNDA